MTKTPAVRPALGAALAASIDSERRSVDDRFVQAEHLLAARPEAPAPAAAPLEPGATERAGEAVQDKPVPEKHEKVVRDTFTFPPTDHQRLQEIIEEGLQGAIRVNKSEVVRAGLIALQQLSPAKRKGLLVAVEKLKTGRRPD